ncbi:MAG TPA: VapC toxin family PIN domain ribonuclease [Thiobacillaceae bacterium]|nr:VapC toxin family PIN domain ribonuclease [Thiobacillaceae bacterium]HNI08617.1 VapC toxin family PIN domain ribonuclease [Thiobacillaceae bacterium]
MRALLDVNVLIALLDANHLHHARAMVWLESHLDAGWSSCPITQNGCIRILSQPAYPNAQPAAAVALRLAEAAAGPAHEFWADEVSLLDPACLDWRHVLGARQVTDVYLLALAVRRGGCLVTLDGGIPLKAVAGATPTNLLVLD